MKNDRILLDHGSGGRASQQLVSDLILRYFTNTSLAQLEDSTEIYVDWYRLTFSTDSYVVDPIFFPGGNIGDLAINGTVNDIAMRGAIPKFLSVGFILEEGLLIADFEKILVSMAMAARKANVQVVTGDTKVVPRGAADKIFINTSGIGVLLDGRKISGHNALPGDSIIISGTIADHGVTVLTQREGLEFSGSFASDSQALNHLVEAMIAVCPDIHSLRDPTRGGLATTLNEIAEQSNVGIQLHEDAIPINQDVRAACELLGLDPLYLANEGKLVACVPAEHTKKVLAAMYNRPEGKHACVIGNVVADDPGKVWLVTAIGGSRLVDMLAGEPLPRIC
ncbi:hydrogenase expression/formation protein HypE [candidate division KSB1 bacterium]|nr:hydrogenase expression/formation protein HypE [candidate division KSB1 bacterium]